MKTALHIKYMTQKNSGFTLLELMITVAIIGILAAIGIPQYRGYVDTSRITVVQNNLRAIYMQQQEFMQRNNIFYRTAATCTNATALINTNLFAGQQVLTGDEGFYYCITQTTTADFNATAREGTSTRSFTINNLNVTNF